ncbi:hypothetical protein IAI10_04755 [Clostridium sp. 19966]|uniref:hypothetical protein n=1 Tax=Clostridium sp. 19966 TaxID=2768166 RepID=UPI0028DFF886|nr:hypothetical protein [Clostridium sp. 19966]MDT8715955.1 hypothetical protein [Clostridium sp. 19966]
MEGSSNKVTHIVYGMERKEIISKRFSVSESLAIIINSVIINNKANKLIDVQIKNGDILIIITGEGLPHTIKFNKQININDNILLLAMIKLCNEMSIINTRDNIQTTKVLNFKDVDDNSFEEDESAAMRLTPDNSIEFKISKQNLHADVETMMKSENLKSIKAYLSHIYNELIAMGSTVIIFGEKITYKDKDGQMLNEKHTKIGVNRRVKLYRMKTQKKGIEVIVNGIKLENTNIKNMINWNVPPFKQDGYTFKRLFISLFIEMEKVDLNDISLINEFIEKSMKNIRNKVQLYKEYFTNEKVNINLEYDRADMDRIKNSKGKYTASEATKAVLDGYLELIKRDD